MNKTMTVAAKWFAMVCILALAAFAQSDNSSISGIVKDPSGAVVTGANITVTNEGTGFERKTTTNESGFYTITNIQPGFYKLSVEATGFKKYEKTRNRLEAALPIQVNVDLTV
ncbi:MAG TPA: carboxypeptidase-like regulatory domain-containing protein, partial [Bryobacteraceae bacterium]|nr:carboxypeptidase-like regulatory domain-containing protein [Bryobacteraceae bacterium]